MTSERDIRESGTCLVCKEPTHEVKRRFHDGHPLAGRIQVLGPPLPGTVRVSLALLRGSTATVTLHRDCLPNLTPASLPKLWTRVLETSVWEQETKGLRGKAPEDSEESRAMVRRDIARTYRDVPLGVIGIWPLA